MKFVYWGGSRRIKLYFFLFSLKILVRKGRAYFYFDWNFNYKISGFGSFVKYI